MKNTFGNSVSLTLFGESHGTAIGAVLDGLTPGITVDEEFIKHQLSLRRPAKLISTARVEQDNFKIVSGVFNGKTTGTPLTIIIENQDTKSGDYAAMQEIARPSHADFTANEKYHGYQDYRGGGHFSGRITAPIVAAGAILKNALEEKGIYIATHIKSVKDISDRDFEVLESDIKALNSTYFAVLDKSKEEEMTELIKTARSNGDSVGGVLESIVVGMPTGVGEPWFDTLEGLLSYALFSIPAVKAVEFGGGFEMCEKFGSEANDELYSKDGKILTATNNSGGINGGISNGMPIVIRTGTKPTATIFKEQKSVNFVTKENTTLVPRGRHDPCIVPRARVVADSMIALTLCDILAQRYGTDWLGDRK